MSIDRTMALPTISLASKRNGAFLRQICIVYPHSFSPPAIYMHLTFFAGPATAGRPESVIAGLGIAANSLKVGSGGRNRALHTYCKPRGRGNSMPAPAGRGQRCHVGGSRRRHAPLPAPSIAMPRPNWPPPSPSELLKCVCRDSRVRVCTPDANWRHGRGWCAGGGDGSATAPPPRATCMS